ncbi:MAG: HAD-IC family P-type ATPase, partial [Bacillus sp. (in: firmicutes)]
QHLDGVANASVNFGASKLTVFGETTIEELEKAGAFENIKVIPEKQKFEEKKEPFLKKHSSVIASLAFLIIGWMSGQMYGEESSSSILAYGASILVGGQRLFTTGLKNLFRLEFDMRTLMTIAVIGAAIIGEWGEGATVVILFSISEVLESYSMDKARQSIRSLMDIAPKEALIRRGNQEFTVEVDDIRIGDILIVKPGQKIAMDGKVVKGLSAVNQAAITGESVPVSKTIDDEVFAGTLNEEGLLEVKVTKHVDDTTIAKIIHLVEEAQAEKAPSQAFVDRFAKYYTPVIMFISLLVAVLPPLLFDGDWSKWVYQGLAVLVVGCPCALVISTPVSIVTAIGNAARNGVLIKGG